MLTVPHYPHRIRSARRGQTVLATGPSSKLVVGRSGAFQLFTMCPTCGPLEWDLDCGFSCSPSCIPGYLCSDPVCPVDSSCELCGGEGWIQACSHCGQNEPTSDAASYEYDHYGHTLPPELFGEICDPCIEQMLVDGTAVIIVSDSYV